MRTIFKQLCVLLASFAAFEVCEAQTPTAVAPPANKQYIYVLHVAARLHDEKAWTPADNTAVTRHFERLQRATQQGKVLLAGRTAEPLNVTFGIVVFEAADDTAAREFMLGDPAVVAGVMTAELHPYAVALMRK